MTGKRKVRIAIGIICLLIAGGILGYILVEYYNRYSHEKAFKDLEETPIVKEEAPLKPEPEPEPEPEEPQVYIPEKNLDWESIKATNPDIYAWLYVPDTDVDYPVLQHPEDDTFYLLHNLDGSEGRPGCIYSEKEYNHKDFDDSVTVLYGHNMRNGTMFRSLHNFEEEEFFSRERFIYIYTPDGNYAYEVFGAFELDDRHLLYGWDFSLPGALEGYLAVLKKDLSGHIKDVEITEDDKLIILSTCSSPDRKDYRYMVTGKRLN